MAQYIPKSTVMAEIEKRKNQFVSQAESFRKIGKKEQESYFAALASNMNSLLSFLDTLEAKEVSSKNPDEQMIAKYLYEKKGYPIDLNGNIPSFEETMKDVENYNKYKEDKFIEKACEWLLNNVRYYSTNALGAECWLHRHIQASRLHNEK